MTAVAATRPNAGLNSIDYCQASLDEKLKEICQRFLDTQDPKLLNARIDSDEKIPGQAATVLGQPNEEALKAAAQTLIEAILGCDQNSHDAILGLKDNPSQEDVLSNWRLRGCIIRPFLSHGDNQLQQTARKAFIALMRAAGQKNVHQRDISEVVEWEGLVDLNALPDGDGPPPTEASIEEPPQEIRNIYEKATDDMVELKLNPQDEGVKNRVNTYNNSIVEENRKNGKMRSDLYQWLIPVEFFSPQYAEAASRYRTLDDKPDDEGAARDITSLKDIVEQRIEKSHFMQAWGIPSASAYVESSKEIQRILSCSGYNDILRIGSEANEDTKLAAFQKIISTMHPIFAFRQDAKDALDRTCTAATGVGVVEEWVGLGRDWDGGSWEEDTPNPEDQVPEPPNNVRELHKKATGYMQTLSRDPNNTEAREAITNINIGLTGMDLDGGESPPWCIDLEWWCRTFTDSQKEMEAFDNDLQDQNTKRRIINLNDIINEHINRNHFPAEWKPQPIDVFFQNRQADLQSSKQSAVQYATEMESIFLYITNLLKSLEDQSSKASHQPQTISKLADEINLVKGLYSSVQTSLQSLRDMAEKVKNSQSYNYVKKAQTDHEAALVAAKKVVDECSRVEVWLKTLSDQPRGATSNRLKYPWATMELSDGEVVIGYRKAGNGFQVCVESEEKGRLVRRLQPGMSIGRGVAKEYCETEGSCNMQASSAAFDKVDLSTKDLVDLHFVATQQAKVRNAESKERNPGSYCCVELRGKGICMLTMSRFRRMLGQEQANKRIAQVCEEQHTPTPWGQEPLQIYQKSTTATKGQDVSRQVTGVTEIRNDATSLESRISNLENRLNANEQGLLNLKQAMEAMMASQFSAIQNLLVSEIGKIQQIS